MCHSDEPLCGEEESLALTADAVGNERFLALA